MNGRVFALSACCHEAKQLLSRSHANEQIVWMLQGEMEFRLGSKQRVRGVGDVARGSEHETWFREDTEVIDFFRALRATTSYSVAV
jgi:hypothetical protein